MNNEQFPRTEGDIAAEKASAQAWGEPVGELPPVPTQAPEAMYPRTEADAIAEDSADQAAAKWDAYANGTLPEAAPAASPEQLPAEAPAASPEEPKTPELV